LAIIKAVLFGLDVTCSMEGSSFYDL